MSARKQITFERENECYVYDVNCVQKQVRVETSTRTQRPSLTRMKKEREGENDKVAE